MESLKVHPINKDELETMRSYDHGGIELIEGLEGSCTNDDIIAGVQNVINKIKSEGLFASYPQCNDYALVSGELMASFGMAMAHELNWSWCVTFHKDYEDYRIISIVSAKQEYVIPISLLFDVHIDPDSEFRFDFYDEYLKHKNNNKPTPTLTFIAV
jgi:hypothetical protein